MDKLKITVFADPVCTWCWGTAPIMRAIEYRYGRGVQIEYVMTGMVDDIRTFSDRRLHIGGEDIALSNRNLVTAWVEASKIHGMPVQEHGFRLFDERHTSTIPQCLAYIAVRKLVGDENKEIAHRYLRVIQQATAAEAVRTSDLSTLAGLAAVVGLAPEEVSDKIESAETKRIFQEGRQLAAHYGAETTPTFLLQFRGKEHLIQGYTTMEAIETEITRLTAGNILPANGDKEQAKRLEPTKENVAHYLSCYGTAFPVDVATAFAIERHSGHTALNIESYKHLPDIIERLLIEEEIAMTPFANSFKIYKLKEERTTTQSREREFAGTI